MQGALVLPSLAAAHRLEATRRLRAREALDVRLRTTSVADLSADDVAAWASANGFARLKRVLVGVDGKMMEVSSEIRQRSRGDAGGRRRRREEEEEGEEERRPLSTTTTTLEDQR